MPLAFIRRPSSVVVPDTLMIHHQTVADALKLATAQLQHASATPRLDADLLLAHALGWSRTQVLAEARQPLGETEQAAFAALIARRQNLEPVAYITGHREFFGLDFVVTPATLVPRPETELLVELAVKWLREQNTDDELRIADIGTGTGCIAIAIAVNTGSTTTVLATDISPTALTVAAKNRELYRVQKRVQLLEGDLLAPLDQSVDLLLSNPPYTILYENDENVNRHEPRLALDGGMDGLNLYRRLLRDAPAKLAPGGALMLEIGTAQGAAVGSLAATAFPHAQIVIHRDLAGHDRVVTIETNTANP